MVRAVSRRWTFKAFKQLSKDARESVAAVMYSMVIELEQVRCVDKRHTDGKLEFGLIMGHKARKAMLNKVVEPVQALRDEKKKAFIAQMWYNYSFAQNAAFQADDVEVLYNVVMVASAARWGQGVTRRRNESQAEGAVRVRVRDRKSRGARVNGKLGFAITYLSGSTLKAASDKLPQATRHSKR